MSAAILDDARSAIQVATSALRTGELPPRYRLSEHPWATRMRYLTRTLGDESRVLDIGAGAKPTIATELRPTGTYYVGLDVDEGELTKAPAGAYDDTIVSEIGAPPHALAGTFDLVLCYRTLEHVTSIAAALQSARSYLRPGGVFFAETSGRYANFAIANRIVPNRICPSLLAKFTPRRPDTVFPAHYDRCWYGALRKLLSDSWESYCIEPLYYGAGYLLFCRPFLAIYVGLEELLYRRRVANLATHYIIRAVR
jgi:SAM-dependent methyltransferase